MYLPNALFIQVHTHPNAVCSDLLPVILQGLALGTVKRGLSLLIVVKGQERFLFAGSSL